jgi:hypothetical protein
LIQRSRNKQIRKIPGKKEKTAIQKQTQSYIIEKLEKIEKTLSAADFQRAILSIQYNVLLEDFSG